MARFGKKIESVHKRIWKSVPKLETHAIARDRADECNHSIRERPSDGSPQYRLWSEPMPMRTIAPFD